jgi:DNA topoisomerase VI subunit A
MQQVIVLIEHRSFFQKLSNNHLKTKTNFILILFLKKICTKEQKKGTHDLFFYETEVV